MGVPQNHGLQCGLILDCWGTTILGNHHIYISIYENDFATNLCTWFLAEAMTAAG